MIQIKDEFGNRYLAFLQQTKADNDKRIVDIQNENADIEEQIKQLRNAISDKHIVARPQPEAKQLNFIGAVDGYSPNFTWAKKIVYALEKLFTPSTTTQIVEVLMEVEPGLDRKQAVASISSVLSVKTNEKEIEKSIFTKSSNERGGNIYGLKKWRQIAVGML